MWSRPRIVAADGKGHTARTAPAAHQLRAFECDHGAVALGDAILTGEERGARHDTEAHALELVQRGLVALIRENDAGTHRHKVAAGRPLLSLLQRAFVAAAEHRLDRHVALGERG